MITLTETTGGADPLGWINYGVLGLLIAGIAAGLFYAKPHVTDLRAERDRAIAERDKADAQRDAMAETFQTQLVPMLGELLKATRALQKLVDRSTGGDR